MNKYTVSEGEWSRMKKDEWENLERLIKEIEALKQELRDGIDEGEIVKPDSGNLIKDVLEAIEKYVTCYKQNLKVRQEVPLQGLSGNWWKIDVVIEDIKLEDRIKSIVECKQIDEGTSYQTYRYAHVSRAYTELADLRNWEKPLKFVIFSRRLDKEKKGFDADALLKSISAEIIDWNDKYDWLLKFILAFGGF